MDIYKKIVLSITIPLLALTSHAHAKIVIKPDIQKQIQAIVAKPQKVYPLDFMENERIFKRIDQWADTIINISQLEPKRAKKDQKTYWIETSDNTPIAVQQGGGKPIEIKKPFRIKYIQTPQKRSLRKAVHIPSEKKLEDQMVADIGKQFIISNGFIRSTPMDVINGHFVVNRLCKPLTATSKQNRKTLTILQRVIFKRGFNGIEVLNSKQIVDIHPDSGEILAYKAFNWTPTVESKGAAASYKSTDDIIGEIKDAFEEKMDWYQVTKIKPGMFQTDKIMLPVLSVFTDRQPLKDGSIPIQRVLIISLVKNIEFPDPRPGRELPEVAKAQ